MNQYDNFYNRYVKISSECSCILFGLAHVLYLIIFSILGIRPLIVFNGISVAFYIIMFILIKKKHFLLYVFLTAIEISFYLTAANIVCGRAPGFELCFIALITLAFFSYYFSKSIEHKISPLVFVPLFMILFVFCYLWDKYNDPIIIVPDVAATILFIFHIIIVFSFSTGFLWVLVNYTVKLDKKVRDESETDKLTNIPNRKGLEKFFNKINGQEHNYLLAFFDIDNFKVFNDINGHLCGDYVLAEIARIAKENSINDFVSRWGGEEFIVVSKIEESLEETYQKIDNIRKNIESFDFKYGRKKLKSTITIGIASYDEGFTLDEWINKADKKLYYGKHHGKNQINY